MTLEEIINGCKKNNLVHQKALYDIYANQLFNLSLKYCNSFNDAEDNLHDSFLEIYSNISKYKNRGSFEGWMKKITINKAISKFKQTIKNYPIENGIFKVMDEEITLSNLEISLDSLLQFIQELPNQYRLVFNLYELDDYSHSEIAKLLSISEGTSKSNLHKAKAILKNKILEFNQKQVINGI
ncbi:RNA polymerase sigma factor [Flavobacterium capsici]|uniref:RNA polymerase sigma factor n=1 Tax=Flavobacterium capsici TaxID=3075618 RepID=A0AA96F384_9FLAO|nr:MULTISPECIES: RNA polymerase sigma factor [unclassified Flavobacterium]WNM19172.1 RNA polymerase sigma factor [Flavobacterium sp. PMR2A8]WNM20561.1 RNA polymerase sigma factor [Flavobacterium sp. PMTSA4]